MAGMSPGSKKVSFPTSEAFGLCMETANSRGGAKYLGQQTDKYLNAAKIPTEMKNNIKGAMDNFVEKRVLQFSMNGDPWSGQKVNYATEMNMQLNAAEQAIKALNGKLTNVKFDFAVSNAGSYVRGYSSGNGPLDSESVTSLDKLVNAWLATKDGGYIVKDGFLYNAMDKVQGENNRINPEKVRELLASSGLQEYLSGKGFDVKMKERAYPGETKEAQVKQDLISAANKANSASDAVKASKAEAPPPEEAPQTSVRSGS